MHAHQLRLLLSAIVLLSLVLGPLSHVVSAAPRVSYVTTPGDDSWPEIPTKASMVRVSKDLPNDPIAAAEALVRKIYDPNELLARSATAELLRRAGIPVYASDGQPVRDPDKYVLRDIVINDVSLIVLTRDTRLNDFYSPKQLETLLVGMHILKKGFPVRILIETLGQWGKGPKAPVESKVAGAAVRTLSGRRGQLFYSGADPKSLRIDPLQTIIVMAHSASRTTDVAHKRTGKTAGLGSPVRQKDVGPCNAFANSLLSYPLYGPVKDLLKKEFTDQLKKIAKGKYEKQIGNAADAYDILTDLAGALLTILGAQITVTADKYQTHFKHRAGSTKEEVTVKAETAFSSFLSDNFRSCLSLGRVCKLVDWEYE